VEDEGTDLVVVVAIRDAGDEEDLAVPALRADVGASHELYARSGSIENHEP
jgi:hypothetical protein